MRIALRQLTIPEMQALLQNAGPLPWPGTVHPGAVPPRFVLQRAFDKVSAGGPGEWWLPFLVVESQEQAVVGGCAFKGPPKHGQVEVLYGIAKPCRGRGLAAAALAELAAVAFGNGAEQVLAEIEPRNAGSLGVVRKCGFRRVDERTAEDGVVVERWVLDRR